MYWHIRADALEEVTRHQPRAAREQEIHNNRSGIPHYTRQSAFSDRRFAPLKADEVPQLSISLSVLHDFEQCAIMTLQPPHPPRWLHLRRVCR